MCEKPAITLTALEKCNHIIGDIERGVKIYERGGIEFVIDKNLGYVADIPEKDEHRRVLLSFTEDGPRVDKEWIDEAVYAILAEEYFSSECVKHLKK